MRTRKPISTITYNTFDYLIVKLEELRKAKKISFWAFVPHQRENDEAKDHIHLFIDPSVQVQTDDLKDEFREFDPSHPDKPLGCISFASSKFDDWYLYGLHDEAYLASKGQSREIHYLPEEVISSDPDDLFHRVRQIDMLKVSRYGHMLSSIKMGISWTEYFARGNVPIQQINAFKVAYETLQEYQGTTHRADRTTHTPITNGAGTTSPGAEDEVSE